MVGKLEATQLEDLQSLLQCRSTISPTDRFGQLELIMDTGCSKIASPSRDDFVPGTLTPLASGLAMEGISGKIAATHKGRVRYEVFNDNGDIEVLEGEGYLLPDLKLRLFSPQAFFDTMSAVPSANSDTASFQVFRSRSVLHLPNGNTITMKYNQETFLPILPAFKNILETGKTLALEGCVSGEQNQNLTSLQKLLLRWHFKLGHLGFSIFSGSHIVGSLVN